MKSLSKTAHDVLITGSSGFIGTHLCEEFARLDGQPPETKPGNILDRSLDKSGLGWDISTVIHLAGYGTVVGLVSLAPAMYSTAIEGTLNVLNAFRPRTIIAASTCAVYGNVGDQGAVAGQTLPQPLGLYGLSRVATEALVAAWAREAGNNVIVLRFGNVIGPGCGGLIPYLVDHAFRYPDAREPARLRGRGRIVRDYVPVSHVVRVLAAATATPFEGVRLFNLGTGRGTANGQVAEIVTRVLAEQGFRLRIEYSDAPAPGEAQQAILDVQSTTDVFGIAPPPEDAVRRAITDGVVCRLARLTQNALTQNNMAAVSL